MKPFTGRRSKSDPNVPLLNHLTDRIDALCAALTPLADGLQVSLTTIDRLSAQAETAEKEVERLDDTIETLRADLFDRDSQLAGYKAQVLRLNAELDALRKRRWWQWG